MMACKKCNARRHKIKKAVRKIKSKLLKRKGKS